MDEPRDGHLEDSFGNENVGSLPKALDSFPLVDGYLEPWLCIRC